MITPLVHAAAHFQFAHCHTGMLMQGLVGAQGALAAVAVAVGVRAATATVGPAMQREARLTQ